MKNILKWIIIIVVLIFELYFISGVNDPILGPFGFLGGFLLIFLIIKFIK